MLHALKRDHIVMSSAHHVCIDMWCYSAKTCLTEQDKGWKQHFKQTAQIYKNLKFRA